LGASVGLAAGALSDGFELGTGLPQAATSALAIAPPRVAFSSARRLRRARGVMSLPFSLA
jgi:hypothetical protein